MTDWRTLAEREIYTSGDWGVFTSPWSTFAGQPSSGLVAGRDYADRIMVRQSTFPANTRMDWYWPTAHAPAGVYGYNPITRGNYDNGPVHNRVTPVQFRDLSALEVDYEASWTFALGDANIMSELYALGNPNDPKSKRLEVGIYPHISAASMSWLKQSGTVLGKVGGWTVWLNKPKTFVQVVADTDQRAGTLGFLAVIRLLMGKGLLTGAEWYTGIAALGVEPIFGGGSLSVAAIDVVIR